MRSAKLLFVTALAFSSLAFLLPGCDDDEETGTSSDTKKTETCPGTFQQANEEACVNEGVQCLVSTLCSGTRYEQATCFCIEGKFSCFNPASDGKPIKGKTPPCAEFPKADDNCPADVPQAQACDVAGKSCQYVGQLCKGARLPLQDSCICQLSGDAGLAFDCQREACPGEAPPIPVKDSGPVGDGG